MAEIPGASLLQLKRITRASLEDCRQALTLTGGNVEQAAEYLREKGIARSAAEEPVRLSKLCGPGGGKIISLRSALRLLRLPPQYRARGAGCRVFLLRRPKHHSGINPASSAPTGGSKTLVHYF